MAYGIGDFFGDLLKSAVSSAQKGDLDLSAIAEGIEKKSEEVEPEEKAEAIETTIEEIPDLKESEK
ncbi:MAG: hypothetical protein KIT41_14230 [Pyrinomonadaceae bacterium]|nr:hypothetical protein [Pyrinomonadaceae bacterium]